MDLWMYRRNGDAEIGVEIGLQVKRLVEIEFWASRSETPVIP